MFPAQQSRRGWTVVATAASPPRPCSYPPEPPAAAPAATACNNRTNNTYDKLLGCVTVDGVLEHEQAFQAIADANGGNRAAGTTGYTESVDYVVETLKAAGWNVRARPVRLHVRATAARSSS